MKEKKKKNMSEKTKNKQTKTKKKKKKKKKKQQQKKKKKKKKKNTKAAAVRLSKRTTKSTLKLVRPAKTHISLIRVFADRMCLLQPHGLSKEG